MTMFAITTNGVTQIVDAPSKSAANAYANAHTDVKVAEATRDQLMEADLKTVPVVLKGGRTQEEIDAEAVAAAARKEKAEAKKAQKAAAATA